MRTRITGAIVAVCLSGIGVGFLALSVAKGDDHLEWLYQGHSLDYWVEQLHADKVPRREQAVQAVGSFVKDDPRRVRSQIIEMLDDPSTAVRSRAVRELSWRSRPRLTPPQAVIDALVERLVDPSEHAQVRRFAARGLANLEIGGATALDSAIDQITEVTIRVKILEELSRTPDDLLEEAADMAPVRAVRQRLPREQSERSKNMNDRMTRLREVVKQVREPREREYALSLLETADRIGDITVNRLVAEVNNRQLPAKARMAAMRGLLSFSDHEPAGGAVAALAAALDSENEQFRFWAASALAAVAPESDAGERAIDVLVAYFVEKIHQSEGVGEPMMWMFRFATMACERRAAIFEGVVARLDDVEKIVGVEQVRLGTLEDIDALTPQVLVSVLKYDDHWLRLEATELLRHFEPTAAKKAAGPLAKLLENLPEDREQASQLAEAIIETLAYVAPEAKQAPQLSVETLLRLAALGVPGPDRFHSDEESQGEEWLLARYREQGNTMIDALARAVDRVTVAAPHHPPPRIPILSRYAKRHAASKQAERGPSAPTRAGRFTGVLAHLGNPAVPALKQLLMTHADDYRGARAAAALGQIEPRGVRVLVELAEHGEPAVQDVILDSGNRVPRGLSAILLATFKDAEASPDVRRKALAWLYGQVEDDPPDEFLPLFIEKLDHENKQIARGAVFAILQYKKSRPKVVLDAFSQALPHVSPTTVNAILLALQDFGEKALPALPAVRQVIERSQGQRGADAIQVEALRTIAAMGPAATKRAEAFLRDQLDSPNRLARFWAAIALSRLEDGVPAARLILIEMLNAAWHPPGLSSGYRNLAAEALVRIGPGAPSAIEPLPAKQLIQRLPDHEPPSAASKTLLAMGPAAVGALKKALGDDEIAQSAAKILAKMGPTAAPAVPQLLNMIRDRGIPGQVREAAITALGKIGEAARPAIPYLKALTQTSINPNWQERDVAKAACNALEDRQNDPSLRNPS